MLLDLSEWELGSKELAQNDGRVALNDDEEIWGFRK